MRLSVSALVKSSNECHFQFWPIRIVYIKKWVVPLSQNFNRKFLICLSRNLSRGVKKSKSGRKGIKRENHGRRSGPSRFQLLASCPRVPVRFSQITPEQNLALQLRMRVMETLAVKKIDDRCHHERQQKLCSSFRKSRKKPFCCHVIEINDGTFKNNLDYLGDVYS